MRVNPLANLLAAPLQAAIGAQHLALQQTLVTIEAFGIDDKGQAKVFHLRAERTAEERVIDPVTKTPVTRLVTQPFDFSVPLLALLPVSTVQLQEMTVDFAVEITDIRQSTTNGAPAGPPLPMTLALFSGAQAPGPLMKIQMRIAKQVPEGLARMGDVLAELLAGRGQEGRPIGDIPAMPNETMAILKNRGITTVPEFLSATEALVARADFAASIGVSVGQIEAWRKAAAAL